VYNEMVQRVVDHLHPSTVEVKNEWSFVSKSQSSWPDAWVQGVP